MSEESAAQSASTAQTESGELSSRVNNRSRRPQSHAFRDFVSQGWERTAQDAQPSEAVPFTQARRESLSGRFPGERIVIPAGSLKVRSNDTDYPFRAHSAFIHLTGLERDAEPDALLVLEPTDAGHDAALFFRPRAGADTEEFFSDSRYGEYWVGPREDLETMRTITGITARPIADAPEAITKDLGSISVRLLRAADQQIDLLIDTARAQVNADADASVAGDDELAEFLSELRLIKDDFEVARLREAVAITREGFEAVVQSLPAAVAHERGERVVETAFEASARTRGNGVGYDTIAASGDHACTLHWIKNTGSVENGDLILVDAGAEADSLYTADVTRTLPVNGTFSDTQAKIYDAVLEAADAAFAVAAQHAQRPVIFAEVHDAAMEVLAHRLDEFGLLPVSAAQSLSPEGQQHRRWMVHGTSHHLGLDVHDCAQARADMYLGAQLKPGMVFTIEPGLYFKAADQLIPQEFRGIGVRIEDDVLVTQDGVENLSAEFPRTRSEVEEWVRSGQRAASTVSR